MMQSSIQQQPMRQHSWVTIGRLSWPVRSRGPLHLRSTLRQATQLTGQTERALSAGSQQDCPGSRRTGPGKQLTTIMTLLLSRYSNTSTIAHSILRVASQHIKLLCGTLNRLQVSSCVSTSRSGPLALQTPCREDVLKLKRLQRDAFEQMLRLDMRLDEFEERAAKASGESGSGPSALFGGTRGAPRALAAPERAPIQASGQLVYGAAVPLHVWPCLQPPVYTTLNFSCNAPDAAQL